MSFKLAIFQLLLCLSLFATESVVIFNSIPKNFKQQQADLDTLVLVNVLFRHGNRTPSLNELYPKDPYLNFTYFPVGHGQLTNAGKRREYSIGQSLRGRYGRFFGPYYYPDLVDSRTTDYNRTKMSLDLVHASLFQPLGTEKWNFVLDWQPIPYNYAPTDKDRVLIGAYCPNYIKLYDEYITTSGFQEQLSPYKEVFDYISNNTGLNVTTYRDVYNLYFGLSTEEEWGFTLPEWTKSVWPETITNIAIQQYYADTGTKELASMANGYFLEKLISDARAKTGKLPEKIGRKLYLYSAHENNLGDLLVSLGIFGKPHIPTYGSYIVFEVHQINRTLGFRIFYQHYVSNDIEQLILPGCDEFCSLDKFVTLYQDLLPSEDLCGN